MPTVPTGDSGKTEKRDPPSGVWATVRQLGPGMILSGSIVGSGELIATTTLGARVGMVALWLIVLSCVIKVVVQEMLGRHTITSGDTTFRAFDKVPGPRWRVSWVVWCWMLMLAAIIFQQGGIMGGAAQVLAIILPQFGVGEWTIVIAAVTMLLLGAGRYGLVELGSTVMVVSFTAITVVGAVVLQWTPYSVGLQGLVGGFKFILPADGLAVAFAVFGITGVGAAELAFYPYWCLEKGYARSVGPADGSAQWLGRARGWIRVMRVDTLTAMAVYTVATVAFYVLGASVLFGIGKVPVGYDMVGTLSRMYTETFGPGAFYLFLAGAFFVLYSTVFSATASNSRVLVDFFQLTGAFRITDEKRRKFWIRAMVASLLTLCAALYLLVGEPVYMVVFGGIAQACMLPIIGFSTLYLRYRRLEAALRPGVVTDVLLWLCSTLMLSFALYAVAARLIG